MKKKLFLIAMFIGYFAINAHAVDFASKLDDIYSKYVRTGLISLVVLFIAIGGVANIGNIRKGGEEAREGFLNIGRLALYPVLLFIVVELAKVILNEVAK